MNFLQQGGFGFYVWASFGVTFALMIAEVVQLGRNRRTILARVGRLSRLRGQRADAGSHRRHASESSGGQA
ncbi:heme exporter protein CcmD [Thiohalocapsa marina]|nr:heme exporter protein CcmD [Thiohalocapsa marina]